MKLNDAKLLTSFIRPRKKKTLFKGPTIRFFPICFFFTPKKCKISHFWTKKSEWKFLAKRASKNQSFVKWTHFDWPGTSRIFVRFMNHHFYLFISIHHWYYFRFVYNFENSWITQVGNEHGCKKVKDTEDVSSEILLVSGKSVLMRAIVRTSSPKWSWELYYFPRPKVKENRIVSTSLRGKYYHYCPNKVGAHEGNSKNYFLEVILRLYTISETKGQEK